ncbi:uncharacterized protein LOC108906452 isoform X2 [Anoplophora glabripennis]|uniref:uncharacterized protein LOC108906452 isoform X2 n=1 Tax=Anoplophora glabripennis TaxID=217634 RepID=UPI000874770E|nr:uncharacterized protein LOC108906452 isoform X2 [Anoplophora glabripennis]
MIMINSSSAQKVGKPPPPVPPRPSKSVVAEALAKSRHHNKVISIREAEKTKSPTRQAPPPPTPRNELTKSKSTYSINIPLKKPMVFERSISEEVKNTSRPVIYQSSNVKCNNNNNSVQITRGTSDVKIVNNNTSSLRNRLVGKQEKLEEEDRSRVQVSRKESVKREKFRGEEFIVKHNEGSDASDGRSMSNASTLEKSSDSSEKNGSNGSLDKKNWDQMLNDRNHVNTLIDEMFASVLEVQFSDDNGALNQNNNKLSTVLSQDKTEIIINDATEIDYENVRFDNGVIVSSGNGMSGESNVPKTVIVIKNDSSDVDDEEKKKQVISCSSNTSSAERQKQVKFKDQLNHELLIKELQCMKQDQDKILKRQRKPSMNLYDNSAVPNSESTAKIPRPDWLDVGGGGREVKLNTCQIEITDESVEKEEKKPFNLDYERITKMSSLHGLPPLPKSLSGFNLLEGHQGGVSMNPPTPMRSSSIRSTAQQVPPGHLVYPPHPKVNGEVAVSQVGGGTSGRKSTNLDTQLAILRREMYSLRQLDLSLLSQLWSLNESIQDFRQILQDQEDRVMSPPSPSPTPSSGEDMDGDEFYMSASSLNFRPAPPPPPSVRRPSSSSNASSLG